MTTERNKTRVSNETREVQRREEQMDGSPGKMPTAEEEQAAEKNELDPEVAAANKEAAERGARQQGEGRIEG